jgi:hypothetical protein
MPQLALLNLQLALHQENEMKLLTTLALALLLTGCFETVPKKEIVIEYEYIVRRASPELKMLPPQPQDIDPTKANQLDLADWIVANEARMLRLEAIIESLIKFYEAPVKLEEKKTK